MKFQAIPLSDVFTGKNWTLNYTGDEPNPDVEEALNFIPKGQGLFSGVAQFADGTKHPCLAVKSLEHNGEQIDTFVYTKMGWMNIMADGLVRVLGKYAHDVFPFDVYMANPWEGDGEVGDRESEHRKVFAESLEQLKSIRYDSPSTQTRKRLIPGTGNH